MKLTILVCVIVSFLEYSLKLIFHLHRVLLALLDLLFQVTDLCNLCLQVFLECYDLGIRLCLNRAVLILQVIDYLLERLNLGNVILDLLILPLH